METKIDVKLGDIQKTLFMPVWARAVEAKKVNPDHSLNRDLKINRLSLHGTTGLS